MLRGLTSSDIKFLTSHQRFLMKMMMIDHTNEEAVSSFGQKCRGEKHVSFPPDEEMVSSFTEKRNVPQNGGRPTLSEIIAAYKQSCKKHKVEPNPKTLDQIKDITCLDNRAKCLDLKGVCLDYRSCETLEEILKSIRFGLINLEDAELEENGASSLMDMILYYESATHLDVSSNTRMGVSGWKALSNLLKQSRCLWRMDARNIPMLEFPTQALSKALLTSRLTVLHLENTRLSGRPLFTLVGSLKKNAALQELYLGENDLNGYQDALQLGDLLRHNRTLNTLDLTHNAISDSGLEEICEGLRVQKSGLRVLVLCNNQITHHGLTHLGNVLPILRTLEVLDLSENKLENRGIHMLKEPLMINRSLTQLLLASVGITCEGAVALAEFLAESRLLWTLDVKRNRVLTGGLMAFALALKINRSLCQLDLDPTPEEEEKDEFLAETQKALLSRISELCFQNNTTNTSAVELTLHAPLTSSASVHSNQTHH